MSFSNKGSLLDQFDQDFRTRGFLTVVGIDEVGRGCFAGPVVAAACSLDKGFFLPGINDSKSLTKQRRVLLYQQLTTSAHVAFGLGMVDVPIIDAIGIDKATLLAMKKAFFALNFLPDCLLIDGRKSPDFSADIKHVETVVQGDKKSACIAAASIIAKVRRDWMMSAFDAVCSDYYLSDNKGYGTKKHQQALEEHGIWGGVHRESFTPIQNVKKSAFF